MNIEYIEEIIEREKINLIDTYLENADGAYVNYNKLNMILYDSSKLQNKCKKKQVLAEELGHYYYSATYKFNSDLQIISKQEYKAKKFMYYTLIPFDNLRRAILNRKRYSFITS